MPEHPDDYRPIEEFDDHFERLLSEMGNGGKPAPADIGEKLDREKVQGGHKLGRLEDIEVEFVRNPARGADFDRRHNDLLITREVIETLLSQEKARISAMRTQVARSGGFLMRYDRVGEQRLHDVYDGQNPVKGGWLMAETSGIPLDRSGQRIAGRVLGADGQFYIPPDDDTATPDPFPLLQIGKDSFLDAPMTSEEVRTHPQTAMLIADISSVREFTGYGFSAATEDAAFLRVVQEINAQRSGINAIKYALAAIASVKGVMDKNKVLLAPALDPEGMRNYRSMFLHTLRGDASGDLLGKQVRHLVPVELPAGDEGFLYVDWYVTSQRLENATMRSDLALRDELWRPDAA